MKDKLIFCVVSIMVVLSFILLGVASVDMIIHSSHWIETVIGFIIHDYIIICIGASVCIFIYIIKKN